MVLHQPGVGQHQIQLLPVMKLEVHKFQLVMKRGRVVVLAAISERKRIQQMIALLAISVILAVLYLAVEWERQKSASRSKVLEKEKNLPVRA